MYLVKHAKFKALLGDVGVKYLHGRNVRHVEQLVSAINDELGQRALKLLKFIDFESLKKISDLWIKEAEESAESELIAGLTVNDIKRSSYQSRLEFINGVQIQLPSFDSSGRFGSKLSNYSAAVQGSSVLPVLSDDSDPRLPSAHILYEDRENAPMAIDQGTRGTCVAFAACSVAEHLLRHSNPSGGFQPKELSKQWVYYKAKLEDSTKEHLPGTTLKIMAEALENHGFVLEENLPYRAKTDEAQALLFKASPGLEKLESEGRQLRLTKYSQIKSTDVISLKSALVEGSCVILVVPVYQRAWLSPYVIVRGEVELPFQDPDTDEILDERQGFHAITLYGFKDTPENRSRNDITRPGGGYFIFRNSWGERWGTNRSETPAGYGILPYAYVQVLAADAMIFTEITRFSSDQSQPLTVYRIP